MITSFEVGAVFKIINEASPALAKILKQVRELNAAITKAKESLATLSGSFSSLGLGTAVTETGELAAAWGDVAKNAAAARRAIGSASSAAARSQSGAAAAAAGSGGGGGRQRLGTRLGGGGGGAHINGPSMPIAGGGHMSFGGPAAAAVAAAVYGVVQDANYDDSVIFMAQHAGVDLKENRTKFRKMLTDATQSLGYSEHDVSMAAQQELRMFGDTGGSNGVDVLPKMLKYSATEARLKNTTLEESMSSMTGLAHMLQTYGEDDVDKLAPSFSALSVRSPLTLAQQERAFGYAVPMLHSAMKMDPMTVMAASTALARAGITNTKSGTWIREMMMRSMPGTVMMSATARKKHHEAEVAFGLVDANDKPTFMGADGKPDMFKMLEIAGDHAKSIPLEKLAGYEKGLFGAQGGGAFAVLNEPAVRDQMKLMRQEMTNPDTVNRMRNFNTVYGEESTVQGARQTLQTFNVTMADLGDKILPSVSNALGHFRDVLQGIQSVIPGGQTGKTGGAFLAGAVPGAIAGFAYAGPPGAVVGGLGGGLIGAGIQYSADQGATQDKKQTDDFINELKRQGQGGAAPQPASQPISVSANIDGKALFRILMDIGAASFSGQAPAFDGTQQFTNGDHQHSDK